MITMGHPPLNAENLRKLTIPQLKALCKERKITGYSKLQKNAIIDKLLASQPQTQNPQNSPNTLAGTQGTATAETVHNSQTTQEATSSHERQPFEPTSQPTVSPPQCAEAEQHIPVLPQPDTSSAPPGQSASHLSTTGSTSLYNANPVRNPAQVQKRANDLSPTSSHAKKPKTSRHPNPVSATNKTIASVRVPTALKMGPYDKRPSVLGNRTLDSDQTAGGVSKKTSRIPAGAYNPLSKAIKQSRRYKPLPPARRVDRPVSPPPRPSTSRTDQSESRASLDLSVSSSCLRPILHPIGLPPPLSQRRLVATFSIAFSLVELEDLKSLSSVSRLFRFAAYHSAVHRLKRLCSGARLTEELAKYPSSTTNFWPYLKARQKEQQFYKEIIDASILGDHICKNNISSRLLFSPDNPKQATIAARFLLTHLFFEVSIGMRSPEPFTVLDSQEVVPHEIWMVTIHSPGRKESFHVLEATCEVVGSTSANEKARAVQSDLMLEPRADWSAHIRQYLHHGSQGLSTRPLLSLLKWAHQEEYFQGISKLWIKRVQEEGELGRAKLTVAERYVLACVVGNSISGRWMSSTEMAQEFNGLPSTDGLHEPPSDRIHLFLPGHHHVESLHFVTSRGQALHTSVAAVQTPNRTYYILRDNGMQIGCEEDGIADVWRVLLKCTEAGVAAI